MRAAGRVLNYEVSGSGPVVVLLHGYLCSLRYWDALKPLLVERYTVVTIDLLGFGSSMKPADSAYDYAEHVAWIRRTVEECAGDRPIILAGHSMGALLALRYAAQYPDQVSRLLLVNMPLFANPAQARRELSGTSLLYRVGLYWGLHLLIWPLMRNCWGGFLMRQTLPLNFRGMETYVFAGTAEARARSLRNVIERQDIASDMWELRMPVALVVGKEDRAVYQQNVSQGECYRDCEVLMLDGGHHLPLEDPGRLAQMLDGA